MNPPTESQLHYIKRIEKLLDIEFKGTTKQEAFLFIWENNEAFHKEHQTAYRMGRYKNYKRKSNYGGGSDERGFHSISQGFSGDESDFY